jgi:hypothetical protein
LGHALILVLGQLMQNLPHQTLRWELESELPWACTGQLARELLWHRAASPVVCQPQPKHQAVNAVSNRQVTPGAGHLSMLHDMVFQVLLSRSGNLPP